jgi:hypothetical protein
MSDWLTYLLDRMGESRPCDLCGTPTMPADLTETTIPSRVLDFGVPGLRASDPDPVILRQVIWVCPRCPLPGGLYRPGNG